jgi:DNA-binding CsgD family transcriptional regulator
MAQPKPLSDREWEVVEQVLQGKSNKMIASSLGISRRTVEFHLKNIYAKYEVRSRIELVLKLGSTTGDGKIQKLGSSTVDAPQESAENRDTPYSPTDWAKSFRETVSMLGTELQVKNLLNSKHVGAGVVAALITGLLWLALLQRYGHTSMDEVWVWALPLALVLALIGLSVGIMGKRNGSTPGKVAFAAWFGTGVGSVAMLPLVALIVVPLGKLAEWLGLVNRATMPGDVASNLVIIGMLGMWLIVATAIGIGLLYVSIRKPQRVGLQPQTSDRAV